MTNARDARDELDDRDRSVPDAVDTELPTTIDPEEPETWPEAEVMPLETDPADWAEQRAEVPIDDEERVEGDDLAAYPDEAT